MMDWARRGRSEERREGWRRGKGMEEWVGQF